MILHLILAIPLFGQIEHPAKWQFNLSKDDYKAGDTIELVINVTIKDGWYLYSCDFDPTLGPTVTSFSFQEHSSFSPIGKLTPIGALKKYDETWKGEFTYFENNAEFRQKLKVNSVPVSIQGKYNYQVCDAARCIPFDDTFSIQPTIASNFSDGAVLANGNNKESKSLLGFFIISFLAGLAAIITPCVFPMIPMTVSFFMNSSKNKTKAKFQAGIFGISIIAIYTIIGTVVALTLGANFANFLSTHWLPNIFFFLIFMLFAASFFGMFEIVLPSWIVNKSDKQADKGGVSGAFFMAFTLVLVSFSCTGPIVGAILVASASGKVLEPIIGMLGFSFAFSLPFTFFALFPSLLHNLPKSGGWLNSVKVVLGFIEIALGLKFLSVADQTYHWGFLDREVYLALWIVIFSLLGFYLLGKLRFSNDSDSKHISVPRLLMSIITFSFVVYLIPGMFGAPLKALSGYTPPQTTLDFDINAIARENQPKITSIDNNFGVDDRKPKYSNLLHLPHGINGYFDYKEGIEVAKRLKKPVFIDFTGHGCVNCREMEANVWSDPRVLQKLKEKYVVIALYVDDKTKLPENEWYISDYDGKRKEALGNQNADFQIKKYNVNAQPYYVLLDNNENLLTEPRAYNLNVSSFIEFLDEGLVKYKECI